MLAATSPGGVFLALPAGSRVWRHRNLGKILALTVRFHLYFPYMILTRMFRMAAAVVVAVNFVWLVRIMMELDMTRF